MSAEEHKSTADIHHELHSHLPPDPALRVKAMESLLVEKGMLDPATVDEWVETYSEKIGPKCGAAIVARAWVDPDFKARLLENGTEAVKEMDAALAADDLARWAAADEHFHSTLVDLSDNKRLRELVDTFVGQSHRVRMLTLRMRPRPEGSNRDHRVVLDAIARGDVDTARRVHREHREKSGSMLVELLVSHGLNQL